MGCGIWGANSQALGSKSFWEGIREKGRLTLPGTLSKIALQSFGLLSLQPSFPFAPLLLT